MSTVDLVGIDDPTHEMPKANLNNFESSPDDYVKIARKLILAHASSLRANLANELLLSDDAISNIATEIMLADWKWDGRGTKCGYRKQRAIWAMQSYLSRSKSFHKKRMKYIDEVLVVKNRSVVPLEAEMQQPASNETEVSDYTKFLRKRILEAVSKLDDGQKACVKLYYLDGLTMQETANKIGRTRQRVKQILDKALPILENHLKTVEK